MLITITVTNDFSKYIMLGGLKCRIIIDFVSMYCRQSCNNVMIVGGVPPVDQTMVIPRVIYVSQGLYAGICSMAFIGILLCIGFLSFNTYFRKLRFDVLFFIIHSF